MIIKFKLFENNIDIDPYGEEDWNEVIYPQDNEWVLCIKDHPNFEEGKKYKVLYVNRTCVWLNKPKSYGNLYQSMGFHKEYFYDYFERIIDENFHLDIDPYGEEDWNEIDLIPITYGTEINVGDKIYYHYHRNGNPLVMGVVKKIVKSPFDGQRCYIISGVTTLSKWHNELIGCGAKIKI